jgi:hypothetical protein
MSALAMTEADLQASVEDFAERFGWLCYHTRVAWKSDAGFPDLVMVRAGRVVVAELKGPRGELGEAQGRWLAELGACPGIETFLWTPTDWPDAICEVLR